ncbi:MAG TPA: ABC transporter permease [Acidimicrobiales bacterium]|nr:ABC transporter permease [Acidimicrobiales bacterium]
MAVSKVLPPALAQRVGKFRQTANWRQSLDVWVPAGILVLLVFACFFGPFIASVPGPNAGSLLDARLPLFSPGHILGTDAIGNDLLSRALYGGRISIEVGLGSMLIGFVVGGSLGILGGYRGGILDIVIMRLLDMFLAFPSIILAFVVATFLGANEINVIFAISFFTVPAFARLARATTLQLRERGFVVATRLLGSRERDVLMRHVVPNVIPSLMTYGLLTVAIAMFIEAALSFLGLGIPAPQPSWGSTIASGQQYLSDAPWIVLVPSVFLFIAVASLNSLGNALRTRIESH